MRATEHIRADIRELADEMTGLLARDDQIYHEIEALEIERSKNVNRRDEIQGELIHLRRALAYLEEHTDAPVVPPHVGIKPKRVEALVTEPKTLPPGTPHRKSKPDPVKAAKKAAKAKNEAAKTPKAPSKKHPHTAIDPLHVHTKASFTKAKSPNRKKPVYTHMLTPAEARATLTARHMSPTNIARAEILAQVLSEQPDQQFSAYDLSAEFVNLFNIDQGTAQTIVSCILRYMYAHHEIAFTNTMGPGSDGKLTSPIWQLTSADERASAGLAVTDDNFAGQTTRPYVNTQERVQIESSGFEQGKDR